MKAIITGASSGIGQAIARQLATEGWQIATATRHEESISSIKSDLEKRNPQHIEPIVVKADLSNPSSLETFLSIVDLSWDCPDLIVCNVGLFSPDTPSTLQIDELQHQLEINAFSAIRTCKHYVPKLIEAKKGMIIFTGTILNIEPRTSAASYTLSKGLLNSYAGMLADELRSSNIRVSRIQPGSVSTPTWGTEPVPHETFVQPEDIAKGVSWMVNLPSSTWVEELIIRPTNKNW
jgi:3-oxoacyl-[acyl-carrier protein] reductase